MHTEANIYLMRDNTARVRFARPQKESFRNVLTHRVKDYFKENNISEKANTTMVLKTLSMLAIYFTPYFIMLLAEPSVWGVLGCFLVMGFGMAGIGMSVMHDAAHGAYHNNRVVNKILSSSIYLISGNAATWRIQHNILHHTFTNIEGMDEDLETSGLIRLHPAQQWKKFHKWQKFYTPFVYGLLTLNWVVAKDFKQLVRYYKQGIGRSATNSIQQEWITLILTKALYFGLFVVLPLIFVPVAWYWIVLGFVLMHITAGMVLSFVFQLAHMVEGVENMAAPEDGKMENEWMEHQLRTTANFSRKSWIVNWFVGGLNFQVEHHLFPTICHIHYPQISKIVKQTAEEFNLPYFEYEKLSQALGAHMRHLNKMAQPPAQPLTA